MKLIKPEKQAKIELRQNRKNFRIRRRSVLIRIQRKWHPRLKKIARERRKTISKLHDRIYQLYFKYHADDG